MPLWFFPGLLGLFAVVSLVTGIWLLLHLPDVARIFSGTRDGEIVPGPMKRRASPSAVWFALLLFNAGWIACIIIWVFVMAGQANDLVVSS